MEVFPCSSTDIDLSAAFYNLPRPLQAKWTQDHDPEDFCSFTAQEQQQWVRIISRIIKPDLCEICEYLEVTHTCDILRSAHLDTILKSFIVSEKFDSDEARHAILLIFQAIQEEIEVGRQCKRLINQEDYLNDDGDVEYILYILTKFLSTIEKLWVQSFQQSVRYALCAHIIDLRVKFNRLYSGDDSLDQHVVEVQQEAVDYTESCVDVIEQQIVGAQSNEGEHHIVDCDETRQSVPEIIGHSDVIANSNSDSNNLDTNECLKIPESTRSLQTTLWIISYTFLKLLEYNYRLYFKHKHIFMRKRDCIHQFVENFTIRL